VRRTASTWRPTIAAVLVTTMIATGVISVGTTVGAGASERVRVRPAPGPVPRGFEGVAYPVPEKLVPGPHVNDVAVTLYDAGGKRVGRGSLPAGTPVELAPVKGQGDTVSIAWRDDLTARASRHAFWAVPSFTELRDMKVDVGGRQVPLPESGVKYHRYDASLFGNAWTPDPATISTNRAFLECKRDTWGMGGQTFAVDQIEDGVNQHKRSVLEEGVRAVDWGVAVPINSHAIHELHRDCDGKTVADFGYTHHTTQWLESLSRATYLLASSPWAGEYRPTIERYRTRVNHIAKLETQPANFRYWVDRVRDSYGNDFTHRTFMMAAALGLASTLAEHPKDAKAWRATAADIARRGVDNQLPNGVNPERGGFDVQYQMYGTWLLELYFSTLGHASKWRDRVERSIDKAVHWMESRVEPNGQIKIRGTTRICVEVLWNRGAPAPDVQTEETVRAFLLWGHLRHDPHLVAVAQKVDEGRKKFGNPCPADYRGKPEQHARR